RRLDGLSDNVFWCRRLVRWLLQDPLDHACDDVAFLSIRDRTVGLGLERSLNDLESDSDRITERLQIVVVEARLTQRLPVARRVCESKSSGTSGRARHPSDRAGRAA